MLPRQCKQDFVVVLGQVRLCKPTSCFIILTALSTTTVVSQPPRSEAVVDGTEFQFKASTFHFVLDALIKWKIQIQLCCVQSGAVSCAWSSFSPTQPSPKTLILPIHLDGIALGSITVSYNWRDLPYSSASPVELAPAPVVANGPIPFLVRPFLLLGIPSNTYFFTVKSTFDVARGITAKAATPVVTSFLTVDPLHYKMDAEEFQKGAGLFCSVLIPPRDFCFKFILPMEGVIPFKQYNYMIQSKPTQQLALSLTIQDSKLLPDLIRTVPDSYSLELFIHGINIEEKHFPGLPLVAVAYLENSCLAYTRDPHQGYVPPFDKIDLEKPMIQKMNPSLGKITFPSSHGPYPIWNALLEFHEGPEFFSANRLVVVEIYQLDETPIFCGGVIIDGDFLSSVNTGTPVDGQYAIDQKGSPVDQGLLQVYWRFWTTKAYHSFLTEESNLSDHRGQRSYHPRGIRRDASRSRPRGEPPSTTPQQTPPVIDEGEGGEPRAGAHVNPHFMGRSQSLEPRVERQRSKEQLRNKSPQHPRERLSKTGSIPETLPSHNSSNSFFIPSQIQDNQLRMLDLITQMKNDQTATLETMTKFQSNLENLTKEISELKAINHQLVQDNALLLQALKNQSYGSTLPELKPSGGGAPSDTDQQQR